MKKLNSLIALLLVTVMLFASCSVPDNTDTDSDDSDITALPFPTDDFDAIQRPGVIGSIVQSGDGNAYVTGVVPSRQTKSIRSISKVSQATNKHLVTMEHSFGDSCYVSGYIGNSLYIIQDFGSLAANKKGIGHKDGTVLLEYGENGYFSISALCENKIIVGSVDDSKIGTAQFTESYTFGYMIYDKDTKTVAPMYQQDNLRFYTAGYFNNGVALVSVKENDKILFGVINTEGEYVVEPTYEMMADEISENMVIVALQTEAAGQSDAFNDSCGRNITYDSTLMVDIQGTRIYERKSSTVGLINTLTGKSVLPCSYSYIERVRENTYFVKDNEGKGFLYDAKANAFTEVEGGVYTYFNSEWMLYTVSGMEGYLVDKDMNRYEITDTAFADIITRNNFNASMCINTNVVSAICDNEVKRAAEGRLTLVNRGVEGEYDKDKGVYTVTVTETGDVLTNVNTFTYPYNGGFLYTVENSLYRYDLNTRESTRIETGFGNFTEDYPGWDATYNAEIGEIDAGVYTLRYNIVNNSDGSRMYLMIIVNDMGMVLFDTDINAFSQLQRNYLGKYDDALYELAGQTQVEDNYYLTRGDGNHFLLQLVRGEAQDGSSDDEERYDSKRIIGNLMSFSLISPFMLDFEDGSEITVSICGYEIPSEYYVYKSEEQSLKLLYGAIEYQEDILQRLIDGESIEIVVSAGEERATLQIEVSSFASFLEN